jgi:hypothetical protein
MSEKQIKEAQMLRAQVLAKAGKGEPISGQEHALLLLQMLDLQLDTNEDVGKINVSVKELQEAERKRHFSPLAMYAFGALMSVSLAVGGFFLKREEARMDAFFVKMEKRIDKLENVVYRID